MTRAHRAASRAMGIIALIVALGLLAPKAIPAPGRDAPFSVVPANTCPPGTTMTSVRLTDDAGYSLYDVGCTNFNVNPGQIPTVQTVSVAR